MRKQLETSGTLYVKIGQWISTRTDLFDQKLTDEFQRLRHASEEMEFMQCALAFKHTGFHFDSIDYTPISTGSIAQVHRCVYKGKVVAVKLQRPDKLQEVQVDASLMQTLMQFVMKHTQHQGHSDALTSLHEVLGSVELEFDFTEEARVMRLFQHFYKNSTSVKVPHVIDSSPTCIIMEYIDTVPYQRDSSELMQMFFEQLFQLKVLHTDMHPGNVAMTPDGTQTVLFDYGSIMHVQERLVVCIKQLMVAWMNGDTQIMVDYMLEYGMILSKDITADERVQLEEFLQYVLAYVEHTDISKFTDNIQTMAGGPNSSIQFDPQLFMMFRTFTLLEGTCKTLDPANFTILKSLEPLVERFAQDPMVVRLKIEDDIRVFFKNLVSE
jgi:ubiquinone biosynthesis protein